MRVKINLAYDTEKATCNGLMVRSIWARGIATKLVAMESLSTPMRIFMKVAGQITTCAAMACTGIRMVLFIEANGFKVRCMEREKKRGRRAPNTMDTTKKVASMERERICGPMDQDTTGSGSTI